MGRTKELIGYTNRRWLDSFKYRDNKYISASQIHKQLCLPCITKDKGRNLDMWGNPKVRVKVTIEEIQDNT